jgi:hypothetical protein
MASKALASAKRAQEKLTAQTLVRHMLQDSGVKDEILFSVFFLDNASEKSMMDSLIKHRESIGMD